MSSLSISEKKQTSTNVCIQTLFRKKLTTLAEIAEDSLQAAGGHLLNYSYMLKYLVFISFVFIAAASSAMHIVVDAGHGGKDHGATRGDIRESEIALHVAQYLRDFLQGEGVKVTMTRDSDHTLSLDSRGKIANNSQAQMLVSIHANASDDPHARGSEIYFQNQLAPDEESLFLASRENETESESHIDNANVAPTKSNDVHAIVEDLQRNSRIMRSHQLTKLILAEWPDQNTQRSNAIRQAPFYLVSKINMPSTLVELGFISNSKEAEKLTNSEYQKNIAQQIGRAIVKFKETLDKDQKSNLN